MSGPVEAPASTTIETATASAVSHRRQRNLRGEGGRLREEAIEAAMRLLDKVPAGGLTLRMVAREAGVAAPSLYRHFTDADAMMKEIIEECWRQVGQTMIAAGNAVLAGSIQHRLEAQMAAFVEYAMERPSRYGLLFALPVGWEHELVGPLRPAYRPILETIEQHAAQGGALPAAGVPAAALLALSLAHGRIALAHLAPARPGNSAHDVTAFVRDALGRLFQRGPTLPSLQGTIRWPNAC